MKKTIIALTVGAGLLGATVAYATIPKNSAVIHACVNKVSGNVRVPASSGSKGPRCRATERALDWNQTGPTGPTGPRGPSGAPGPDEAGATRIHLEFWTVAAGATTTGFVYCPSSRPIATGGGVKIRPTDPLNQDATSADAQLVESYPMPLYGGIQDQADGWIATVRNQTGRPFNGRTIDFTVYAVCSPGQTQIGQ
jgi:hypothetical protein